MNCPNLELNDIEAAELRRVLKEYKKRIARAEVTRTYNKKAADAIADNAGKDAIESSRYLRRLKQEAAWLGFKTELRRADGDIFLGFYKPSPIGIATMSLLLDRADKLTGLYDGGSHE